MRANFRQAWVCAQKNNRDLLTELTLRQAAAMEEVASGSPIKMASANGHSTLVFDPGTGSAAPQEYVEMWENLISRPGQPVGIGVEPATAYLLFCNSYNPPLDPDCPESWNLNLPAANPLPTTVPDATVYAFVYKNLIPITQQRTDFICLRTAAGWQFV